MLGQIHLNMADAYIFESNYKIKLLKCHFQVIKILKDCFGCSLNSVGYKVLPSYLRIIQGDGIDLGSVEEVRKSLLVILVEVHSFIFPRTRKSRQLPEQLSSTFLQNQK